MFVFFASIAGEIKKSELFVDPFKPCIAIRFVPLFKGADIGYSKKLIASFSFDLLDIDLEFHSGLSGALSECICLPLR